MRAHLTIAILLQDAKTLYSSVPTALASPQLVTRKMAVVTLPRIATITTCAPSIHARELPDAETKRSAATTMTRAPPTPATPGPDARTHASAATMAMFARLIHATRTLVASTRL